MVKKKSVVLVFQYILGKKRDVMLNLYIQHNSSSVAFHVEWYMEFYKQRMIAMHSVQQLSWKLLTALKLMDLEVTNVCCMYPKLYLLMLCNFLSFILPDLSLI